MKKTVLFAFILLSISSAAQINLGMSQNAPNNISDTVMAGSSNTYSVWVVNHGPDPFKDTLHVFTSVLDSANGMFGFIVDAYSTPDSISIAANDSVQIPLTALYNISPTGYRIGIDVIVVWPIAVSANIVDSLMFNIWIIDPSGVNEIDLERFIKLYPNPTTDNLTISTHNNVTVEEVRILDVTGKLVLEFKNKILINIQDLAPGIYFVDVQLSNKKHVTGKIIKQNKCSE